MPICLSVRRLGTFTLGLFLLSLPCLIKAQTTVPQPRIVQAVTSSQLVELKGNVHPLAQAQFDQGAAEDAQPMSRILLVLQRSPEQEASLRQLLDDQQSKSSPNFHKWLTPDEFGAQFGIAEADLQAVTQWLSSHGFTNINVGPGHSVIEFSGTVGQIRNAFHTDIHHFRVGGQDHLANTLDPQIPAALSPVVKGIVSLHNFPRKSHSRIAGQFRRQAGKSILTPLLTIPLSGQNFYGMGPGDFAIIYNSKPLIASGIDGTGQTIAVVGETNINLQDVQKFRSMFGLPANFDASNIVLNGEDPGITSLDEEGEADLDVEWAGATAPGATVKFVVSASTPASAGIDLSALYIIEHNLAGVMSESYGECEAGLGAAGNAFYNSLWQQAAAQGISVVVSAGDGGSAGCDNFNNENVATQGLAVSGLASTPYNISLGGTDFDEVNRLTTFWNSSNDSTGTSAKSYIPEVPWNESCAQIGLAGCGASAPSGSLNIVAGSGGQSKFYTKPPWQMGVTGMPNDNHRDQPDVSLLGSPGFNGTGYVYCQSDESFSGNGVCDITNPSALEFGIIGGTSASAPAFAGVMALVNHKQATASNSAPRQGNANYILYALSKKAGASCASSTTEAATCVFNDVIVGDSVLPTGQHGIGTNSVPCKGGTLNCSATVASQNGVLVDPSHTTTEAWTVATGYDMATGLGSVNINNLANSWSSVSTIPTTTALALSPTTDITHGSSENVTVNINVKQTSGMGVPAGDVSLIATLVGNESLGLDSFTLSAGSVSSTTKSLPGGTYSVIAHYAGDGTNAPSDSIPVQVSVAGENSKTFAHLIHLDINANPTSYTATSGTYGSGYNIFRVDVGDSLSNLSPTSGFTNTCLSGVTNCPSGTVALSSTGAPIPATSLTLNNFGFAEIDRAMHPGTYSISASYSGDASYGASTSSTAFTIAPAPVTIMVSTPVISPLLLGNFTQIDASVNTTSNGIAPTGTMQFFLDGAPMGPPVPIGERFDYNPFGNPPFAWADATTGTTFTSVGTHTLGAQYSGDSSYSAGTAAPFNVTVNKGLAFVQSLNASPNQIMIGQQTTISVQVIQSAPGILPTGTVTFFDGGTVIPGTVTYNQLNVGIDASLLYTPSIVGPHTITASYSGDANYQPESAPGQITLFVVGPDFNISSSGLISQVVKAGATATFGSVISVTPTNGFASAVSLSCSLTAAHTQCAVNPASLPNGSGTASVSVTTTANGVAPPPERLRPFGRNTRQPYLILGFFFAALLALLFGTIWRQQPRWSFSVMFFVTVTCVLIGVSGCGGGGSYTPPPPVNNGTPAGTYNIVVTATSGQLVHTTNLNLTVQ